MHRVVSLVSIVWFGVGCSGPRSTGPAWQQAFRAGEAAAMVYGVDLVAAAEVSESVAAEDRASWFAGYAHRAPWDVTDVEGQVQVIRDAVPAAHRPALYTGVVLRHAIVHEGDPDVVVPFARAFGEAVGVSPVDGVRIGLQMGRGDDLPAALALAGRYPEAWQPALAEELGWRAGDDGELSDVPRVVGLLARVPGPSRASFVHGVCRGAAPGVATDGLRSLLEAVAPDEAEACIDALGVVVAQDADPERRRALAAGLGAPRWTEALERAIGRYEAAVSDAGMPAHNGRAPDLAGFGASEAAAGGPPAARGPARPVPPAPVPGVGPPPGPRAPAPAAADPSLG